MNRITEGQWYLNGLGLRLEIVAVDTVDIGIERGEVIAYRYEGEKVIHLRSADLVPNWTLEGAVEAGTVVRCRTVIEGIRVGSKERYVVQYVSDYAVVVRATRADGSLISETGMSRAGFDRQYEIDPG